MESLGRKTGRWYLIVGGGLVASVGLGIWAASNQPMTTPSSVLTGRVVGADGQPVAGARVYVVRGPVALPDLALLTDSSGTFALSAPAPGTYQLGCAADGFAAATVAVEVAAGQPAQVEIRLHR